MGVQFPEREGGSTSLPKLAVLDHASKVAIGRRYDAYIAFQCLTTPTRSNSRS